MIASFSDSRYESMTRSEVSKWSNARTRYKPRENKRAHRFVRELLSPRPEPTVRSTTDKINLMI